MAAKNLSIQGQTSKVFCVLKEMDGLGNMNQIGKTNDVINDPNPTFTTPIETLYHFEVAQLLEF